MQNWCSVSCTRNNANDLVTFYCKRESISKGTNCNVRIVLSKDGIRSIEGVSNTQHEVLLFSNAIDAITWLKKQGNE